MVSQSLRKYKEIFLHNILHVDDTPQRIALGAAAGIFVAWTPTFGFQMILGVALAALVRGNKAAVLPMAWITNPLTNVPISGFSYLVGRFILTGQWGFDSETYSTTMHLMKDMMRLNIWDAAFWRQLIDVSVKVGLEMWVGSCVVGLVVALVTYFLTAKLVIIYRWHRQMKHLPPIAQTSEDHANVA